MRVKSRLLFVFGLSVSSLWRSSNTSDTAIFEFEYAYFSKRVFKGIELTRVPITYIISSSTANSPASLRQSEVVDSCQAREKRYTAQDCGSSVKEIETCGERTRYPPNRSTRPSLNHSLNRRKQPRDTRTRALLRACVLLHSAYFRRLESRYESSIPSPNVRSRADVIYLRGYIITTFFGLENRRYDFFSTPNAENERYLARLR